MSKKIITQQEIAPEASPKTDLTVFGSNFSQSVEPEKPNSDSKPRKAKTFFSVYDIAITSIFIAIGIVLNINSATFPKIDIFGRFSLIYCYCMLCGIILGATRGGICAALSDFLIAFIVPESGMVWMPLITISNFFMAFIPGLIYRLSKHKITFTVLVSAAASFIVCTLGFTAVGETLLYSYFGSAPFYPSVTALVKTGVPVYFAFVIRKSIQQPFWIVLNMVISILILKSPAIKRILRRNEELQQNL